MSFISKYTMPVEEATQGDVHAPTVRIEGVLLQETRDGTQRLRSSLHQGSQVMPELWGKRTKQYCEGGLSPLPFTSPASSLSLPPSPLPQMNLLLDESVLANVLLAAGRFVDAHETLLGVESLTHHGDGRIQGPVHVLSRTRQCSLTNERRHVQWEGRRLR